MALRALIFDVDGTLADTERDGQRVAFNRVLAEAGLEWHGDTGLYSELRAVAGGQERIRHYLEIRRPYFRTSGCARPIARLHAVKTRHCVELLTQGATHRFRP